MRIASLLPSATEIICEIGLQDSLVGVTHECDYPPFVKDLPKVTRTLIPHDASSADIDGLVRERLSTDLALYSLDMPVLESLQPDLLITQALCDVCAVAENEVKNAACSLPGSPRVLNLEPMTLDEVLATLIEIGAATNHEAQAISAVERLKQRLRNVEERTDGISKADRPRVAFLEWIDPLFNAGHWNPRLIEMAGGTDILGNAGQPSRTTSWDDFLAAEPDVIFISCCGFTTERTLEELPALQSQPGWSELACVQTGRVYVTDGNAYFSRPGPRLVDGLEILAHALHPSVHPISADLSPARQLSLSGADSRF